MRKKLRIINFYFFVLFLTAIYYCWKLCNSIFFLDCYLGVCWSEAYLEQTRRQKKEEDVKAKTCLELALEEEKVFDSVGGLGMLEENKKAAGVWCKRLSRHPPILGPSRPAGATFNMSDWPPSTTTEMNLLAFNFEAWKTIIFERGLDELSLRRSARRPKIGRRQSREEAQLATTCYNLVQLATTGQNLPHHLLQLNYNCLSGENLLGYVYQWRTHRLPR